MCRKRDLSSDATGGNMVNLTIASATVHVVGTPEVGRVAENAKVILLKLRQVNILSPQNPFITTMVMCPKPLVISRSWESLDLAYSRLDKESSVSGSILYCTFVCRTFPYKRSSGGVPSSTDAGASLTAHETVTVKRALRIRSMNPLCHQNPLRAHTRGR